MAPQTLLSVHEPSWVKLSHSCSENALLLENIYVSSCTCKVTTKISFWAFYSLCWLVVYLFCCWFVVLWFGVVFFLNPHPVLNGGVIHSSLSV